MLKNYIIFDSVQEQELTEILQAVRCHIVDDDDEFRFNDASTHEGHLRQSGELTWFCSETSHIVEVY